MKWGWRAKRTAVTVAALCGCAGGAAGQTGTRTLYDGAQNTFPSAQGWTTVLVGATESLSGGAVVFNSASGNVNTWQGGYAYTSATLDTLSGYTLTIDLQVLAESHARNNRSGISLIALGDDLRGVELAFWEREIWAQTGPPNLFQHGEGVAFNTRTTAHSYALNVSSSGYALFADGGASPILTGALKDYSSFGAPYNTPNFIFLGDDTTSARGRFALSNVALTVVIAPEPTTGALALPGAAALGLTFRARRRRARLPLR